MSRSDGFFLPMDPPTVTHQTKRVTKRNGKYIFYEDDRLKQARDQIMAALAPHAPDEPLTGGVVLKTTWCFPVTKKKASGTPHTTRPDTDNIQKLLKDCMTTHGFWEDDSQVFIDTIIKMHSDVPGIRIDYREVET